LTPILDKFGLLGQATGHQILILALKADLKGIYLGIHFDTSIFFIKKVYKI
jgi:hypothetical protein